MYGSRCALAELSAVAREKGVPTRPGETSPRPAMVWLSSICDEKWRHEKADVSARWVTFHRETGRQIRHRPLLIEVFVRSEPSQCMSATARSDVVDDGDGFETMLGKEPYYIAMSAKSCCDVRSERDVPRQGPCKSSYTKCARPQTTVDMRTFCMACEWCLLALHHCKGNRRANAISRS